MSADFKPFCDDFYVNARLVTQMSLPNERHALLHYFEQMQKAFPMMTRFRRTDGEASLEEDRSSGMYRWASVDAHRLASGHVNPPELMDAMELHRFTFDQATHQLGISHLEVEYVEVLAGFDLNYAGNHDDVVAESLLSGSLLSGLMEEHGARPIECAPHLTIALSDDCRLQAKVDVVTRTGTYQVRTGNFEDEAISVYATLRRYSDGTRTDLPALLTDLAERAESLCHTHVLPRIVQPLSEAISRRS